VISGRKPIALCCVAILLLAALLPSASGLPLAILPPLLLFVAEVVTLSICGRASDCLTPQAPFLAVASGRAPPIA